MIDSKSHINPEDEKALIQGCLEDNRRYQETFYRKFASKMYGVCKSYAKDRDEAMEFLQEGFITVFKSLGNYRFEGSLEGWVRRVIVFKTIDLLRQRQRYEEVIRDHQYDLQDYEEAHEFELNAAFGTQRIRAFVNELPGKAQLVLKLYVLEGLTHAEIAASLGISQGTSKSQLSYARALLKKRLTENG